MRSWRFTAAALAFGTCLSGCAATTTTSKVAVDYNRIFAKSRDEVLVTNILRASVREPMQFSTMGTVSGGVRNSGSITIPFTNLIGGTDGLTISPTGTINDGINPTVAIVPLADKEFTAGILKPVPLETLDYFLNQGWDPELVLMLTVGGLICDENGAKKFVLNRGDRYFKPDPNGGPEQPAADGRYDKFAKMFGLAPRLPIQSTDATAETIVTMPAKEAMAALKDGIGKGRRIDKIEAVAGKPGEVQVTIVKPNQSKLTGLNPVEVCEEPGTPVTGEIKGNVAFIEVGSSANALPGSLKAYAVLRSVESILYFLGETQRNRWDHEGCGPTNEATNFWPYYERRRPDEKDKATPIDKIDPEKLIMLRINKVCGSEPAPFRNFVQTKFNDGYYYLLRSTDAGPSDRSLTTLTFLNELIALQTSESTITASTPVVTVSPK